MRKTIILALCISMCLLSACNLEDTIDTNDLPSGEAVSVSSTTAEMIVVEGTVSETLPTMDIEIESSSTEETETQEIIIETTVDVVAIARRESEMQELENAVDDASVKLMIEEIKDSYELREYDYVMPNNPLTIEKFRELEPEFAVDIQNSTENIVNYTNMIVSSLSSEVVDYIISKEDSGNSIRIDAVMRDGSKHKLVVVDLLTYGEYKYIIIGG